VAKDDWFWIWRVRKSELGAELEGTEGVRTRFYTRGQGQEAGTRGLLKLRVRAACSDQSQARASHIAEAARKKYGLTGGGQHLEYRGYDGLEYSLMREFALFDAICIHPERNSAQSCQLLAA
jgi:hypothetical protein